MKYIYFMIIFFYGCASIQIPPSDSIGSGYKKIGQTEKEGADRKNDLVARKVMLECGFCTPSGMCLHDLKPFNQDLYIKYHFLPEQCMLKNGYVLSNPVYYYINGHYIRSDKQTKPDTSRGPVPDRSVQRRLNSEWCTKIYPESEVCKP